MKLINNGAYCLEQREKSITKKSSSYGSAGLSFFLMIMLTFISAKNVRAAISDTTDTDCTINIFSDKEEGIVSPLIMGFNIAYCYAPDAYWKQGTGKIPQLLQEIGTNILRYPGGTVTTFFHWQHPTGQGWKDIMDPSFDSSKNKSPSSFMDLDEYLDVCSRLKSEPLIGIDMGSGKKYNRVKEGIEEAKQLLLHCKQRKANVKYFYLDNEPYQPDANYTFTADEYADMVNQYAAAMKKLNNQIKIIVNTHPTHLDYTRTLIAKAGENIDYIDIHYYWKWGHATFANWKSETVMRQGRGLAYREQRPFYRKLADSLGYPNIDLISLEWNIGRLGKNNPQPTQAEEALMAAEEFTQFIQSGMPIATFWPVSWPQAGEASNRSLLDAQHDYSPNKVFDMFKLYKNILGQKMIKNESSLPSVQALSVKSLNSDTIWVYLINKNPDQPVSRIHLHIDNFSTQQYKVVGFNAADSGSRLKIETLKMEDNSSGNFTLLLPQYSLARITLINKNNINKKGTAWKQEKVIYTGPSSR